MPRNNYAEREAKMVNGDHKLSMSLSGALHHLPVIDGKKAWWDNRMIEGLWRPLKYECVHLNAFDTGSEMREGIGKWVTYYMYSKIAISALRCVSGGCRQISSGLMVLKKVSTAALS